MGKEDFAAKDVQTKAGICPSCKIGMPVILKTGKETIYRCRVCGYTKSEKKCLS